MANPWDQVPVYNRSAALPVRSLSRGRESIGTSVDSDFWAFRRLTGDDRPDGLQPDVFMRFQRLASWLYMQNPLARRLADVVTDMCLGGGINIDVVKDAQSDADAQKMKGYIDRFRQDPIGNFDWLLPRFFTGLATVYGELFLPCFVAQNGDVTVSYLEPNRVREVVFSPDNPLQALHVIQHARKPSEKPFIWNVIAGEKTRDGGVRFPMHPLDREADALVRVEEPDRYTYAGEIFYFEANHLGTGRGRSAFEPVFDWLHAYDSFLFGDLRNANLQTSFVWDVEIQGAEQPELEQRALEIRKNPPKPGEVNIHNEKEKWQALSPSLNAASHAQLGSQVKRVIGLALGLPSHLIGAEEGVNRTTSSSSDIPFLRRMEQRQAQLVQVVKTLIDYQLDQKAHLGLLKNLQRPYPYRVVLPELTAVEVVGAAESLYNTTMALAMARQNQLTSAQDSRRIFYAYGLGEDDMPQNLGEQIAQDIKAGDLPDPNAAPPAAGANPGSGGQVPGTDKRRLNRAGMPGRGS